MWDAGCGMRDAGLTCGARWICRNCGRDELQKFGDLDNLERSRGGHSEDDPHEIAQVRDVRGRSTDTQIDEIGKVHDRRRLRAKTIQAGVHSVLDLRSRLLR